VDMTAWGFPSWRRTPADPATPCAGCGAAGALATCPGCGADVCSPPCARTVHGGPTSCAWYDRPAHPGEPASVDGMPWGCDGCGGELPPAAYIPAAVDPDGRAWHVCSPPCAARVAAIRTRAEGR
jgi:hypothetical protein